MMKAELVFIETTLKKVSQILYVELLNHKYRQKNYNSNYFTSKSTITFSLRGCDWQVRINPACTSSGSNP